MSRFIVFMVSWLCLTLSAPVRADDVRGAPVLLVFGDSLSAAYGLRSEQGWVSLLEQRIAREGYGFQVVNASVSGETTAGGAARLGRALSLHKPRVVVLELGANDGLRGLPLAESRSNLATMIEQAQRAGASVVLLGVHLPPNYGERYRQQFDDLYSGLARQYRLPLLPFLLDKVATHTELMQADGMHPRAEGEPQVLDNVWPVLAPVLRKAGKAR
ncbi:MAG: arylesterase [Steroidobacteraceae bacterium]